MCPICSVGVVVSLGLSRWLKVDDSITGLWAGALLLVLTYWTVVWIYKKLAKKPRAIIYPIVLAAYWLLTFLPLYWTDVISNVNCLKFFGINRLVFGSLLGIVITLLAIWLENAIRKPQGGKVLFHYQKVIIPLGVLLITSFVLNILCKV